MGRSSGSVRRVLVAACTAVLLASCGPPVGVSRVSPRTVSQELTRSALNSSTPSFFSENVLHRVNLTETFRRDPGAALAELHRLVVGANEREDLLFALAELSFLYADNTQRKDFYLQAAVSAWAYLFPGGAGARPEEFDPRLRTATDLYNRGLTRALASADDSVVELHAGFYPLPFGQQVEVTLAPDALRWADRDLVDFVPVAELRVRGLSARHRHAGIGAPLAAKAVAADPAQQTADRLGPNARTAVTALLRIGDAHLQFGRPLIRASLELYPDATRRSVVIDGRQIPLEVESTAALAWSLSESPNWRLERRGFLRGDFPASLTFIRPYRPGLIPVVFVHGTASSPGRWANMVNDLLNDPRVRERFQFWFFTFPSGSPIPYSAMLLRNELTQVVQELDAKGEDPALHDMVVIGHSQGGLLVKMTAIDSGTRIWDRISRVPIDQMNVTEPTRRLLERALIVRPLPFVRRLIFMATPHGGSSFTTGVIAGWLARFVTLPVDVLGATADMFDGDGEALLIDPRGPRFGSIYSMQPGSPFLTGLADTQIAPGISAHSIIPVRGAGAGPDATDGFVTFQSARLDGVESELVIPFAGHSVQGHPLTIEEVRRILLEHAAAFCRASAATCRSAYTAPVVREGADQRREE